MFLGFLAWRVPNKVPFMLEKGPICPTKHGSERPKSFTLIFLCPCNPDIHTSPKGPKYLYGAKYGFCSSNFPYGLGKYSLYWYLGPFGFISIKNISIYIYIVYAYEQLPLCVYSIYRDINMFTLYIYISTHVCIYVYTYI